MKQNSSKTIGTVTRTMCALAILLGVAWQARAQDAKASYPSMAPLEQYLMEDRTAEIALARSAAPASIAKEADVMVLERHGYQTAVKGKNGFVCMVERSWTAGIDFPEFWNPKLRGPICFNPAAARTYLPLTIKKTEWALAGQSKTQIADNLKAAFDKKELPSQEQGAMCYMLSKQGYLNDHVGHWHPHLMFFIPQVGPETWGANLADSPIMADEVGTDRLTIFLVPVSHWSDGTADSSHDH
jgi:hypothetical protein